LNNRFPQLKPGFYGCTALRAITAPVGADLNPSVLDIRHITLSSLHQHRHCWWSILATT